MKLVFLLCAAVALAAAETMLDVRQNIQQEKFETVPVVEEEGKMAGDVRQSRSVCPAGWSQYQSRCFLFIHREMSWIEAERYCVRNDANLASIHNPGEYDFIQEMVRGSTGRPLRAWIGGSDAIKDRMWFWSDGSGFNFQMWGLDEPNNFNGIEKCLEMNRSDDYLWNDYACEFEQVFVCGTRP